MAILHNLIHRFNAIPFKIRAGLFSETDKPVLKFMRKHKGSRTVKTILRKNNKFGRLRLSHFRTCYKATVIKTVWCRHEDRHVDQENRTESPEVYQ